MKNSFHRACVLMLLTFMTIAFATNPYQTAVGRDPAQKAPVQIRIEPRQNRQTFGGVGVGAIFYEKHITSFSKQDKQEDLYNKMFSDVKTQYLQLLIRETHEPENDNDDPYTPEFDKDAFGYCKANIQIAKAAIKRNPELKIFATLYTPPPWMKTNNDASGGGRKNPATLKPGMDLELAEYVWAFLNHMNSRGVTIDYLSIANEPDWPHSQPGYCLTPDQNAELFATVANYLDQMAKTHPKIPKPKLVGPNTLSAPNAVGRYVPKMLAKAGDKLDVISSHDYDRRADRWSNLQRLGGGRPIWMSEWCARSKDDSPGMINSAIQYGVSMHDVFQGGANVYLAYDWAYPPRDSGEAFIHIDWGKEFVLTKPYYLFKQWSNPLNVGMQFVPTGVVNRRNSKVKPIALVDENRETMVLHVVNNQDQAAKIQWEMTKPFTKFKSCRRTRTSATENAETLTDLERVGQNFEDELPARSFVTYQFDRQ